MHPPEQDGNTSTACCDLTQQAQLLPKLQLERESGCGLVNPAHFRSTIKIGDILFTNEILFLALGRKEVQKAATLLFTLVHLPRLPPERPAASTG